MIGLLWLSQTAWAEGTTLVPAGAVWSYLDDGSNSGSSWREPGFDASGWPQGPSQLGFGDGDESTVLDAGPPASPFVTADFRHSVSVAD